MRVNAPLTETKFSRPESTSAYKRLKNVSNTAYPAKWRTGALVAGACLLVAGCSADVTRFDFPAFGLSEQPTTTGSLPVPPEPTYPRYAPNEQTRPYQKAQPDVTWGGTFGNRETASGGGSGDEAYGRGATDEDVQYGGAGRNAPAYAPNEPRRLSRKSYSGDQTYSTQDPTGTTNNYRARKRP